MEEDEAVFHNHGGGVLMARGFEAGLPSSYEKLVAPLKRREPIKNLGGGGMTKCAALLCENSFRGLKRSPYISTSSKWYCSLACSEREDVKEAKASLRREAAATRWVPTEVSLYTKKRIADVSAGQAHCALITTRGVLYTWGYGEGGRLGHGDEEDRHRPTRVRALRRTRIGGVAAGGSHTLVHAKRGGALYTFGLGANGRCGVGKKSVGGEEAACVNQLLPVEVPIDTFVSVKLKTSAYVQTTRTREEIIRVAAGQGHSAAVTRSKMLFTWGWGECGQLGHGGCSDEHTPRRVDALFASGTMLYDVELGAYHSLARSSTADVYSWGANGTGQLGHGDTTARGVPTLVEALEGDDYEVVKLAAGGGHSAAVLRTGECFMWGECTNGRLGFGDARAVAPVLVPTLLKPPGLRMGLVRHVAFGESHTALLDSEGTLFTCGVGSSGELAQHPKKLHRRLGLARVDAATMLGGARITSAALGGSFSIFTREGVGTGAGEGMLVCGNDQFGQLGLDDPEEGEASSAMPQDGTGSMSAMVTMTVRVPGGFNKGRAARMDMLKPPPPRQLITRKAGRRQAGSRAQVQMPRLLEIE